MSALVWSRNSLYCKAFCVIILPGGVPDIQNMRIVLLGARYEGKSSSGNTILGRNAFDTSGSRECVKGEGEALNRHITLVVAPGWWRDNTLEQTNENDKQEIVLSVSLCPPGPHALLLVIKITSPFEPIYTQAMEEHLKLFGETVWNHIIILFTHGCKVEEITIEEYIKDEGEPLQMLLEKCGNRYHVFNNMEKNNNQVIELLQKVEQMLEQSKFGHFEIDRNVLQGLIEKRNELEEKVERRRMMMLRPDENLQSKTGKIYFTLELHAVT